MSDIWKHSVVLEVLFEKRAAVKSDFRTAVQNEDILQENALAERLIEMNRVILKIQEEEKKRASVCKETSLPPPSNDTDNQQRKRPPEPVTQPVLPSKISKSSHVEVHDGSSSSIQSNAATSSVSMRDGHQHGGHDLEAGISMDGTPPTPPWITENDEEHEGPDDAVLEGVDKSNSAPELTDLNGTSCNMSLVAGDMLYHLDQVVDHDGTPVYIFSGPHQPIVSSLIVNEVDQNLTGSVGESSVEIELNVLTPDTSSHSPVTTEEEERNTNDDCLGNGTGDDVISEEDDDEERMSPDPGIIVPSLKRETFQRKVGSKKFYSVVLSEHESDIVRLGANEVERAHEFLKIAFGYGRKTSTEDLIKSEKYQEMLEFLKDHQNLTSDYFSYFLSSPTTDLMSTVRGQVNRIRWDTERETIAVIWFKILNKQTLKDRLPRRYTDAITYKCRCQFCTNQCRLNRPKSLQVKGRCDKCHKANNVVPQYSWERPRQLSSNSIGSTPPVTTPSTTCGPPTGESVDKQVETSSESRQSFILVNPMPNSDTISIEVDATSHIEDSEDGHSNVFSPDTSSHSPAIIEEEYTSSDLGNGTGDEEVDRMSLDPGIIVPCFKRNSCAVLRNDNSVVKVFNSVILSEHESDIVRQGVNEIDRAHEFLKIAFGFGRGISAEQLVKSEKYQAMLKFLKKHTSDYFSYFIRPNKKTLRSRGFLNVCVIWWNGEREAISVTCYKIFNNQTLRGMIAESTTTSKYERYYGGTFHKCRCHSCINTCDARGQKVLEVKGRCDKCHKANNAVDQYASQLSRAVDCELDPSVFNQCKEMIRPVKNALDHLDPDPDNNSMDQVEQTMSSVITIGRRIDSCVQNFEKKKKREWIRYLWCFVSKFTNFEGIQLYKVYRKAVKKGNLHSK